MADSLSTNLGSGKPFPSNKRKQFTLMEREPSHLIPDGNLPDFRLMRIRALSSIIYCLIFYIFIFTYFLFLWFSILHLLPLPVRNDCRAISPHQFGNIGHHHRFFRKQFQCAAYRRITERAALHRQTFAQIIHIGNIQYFNQCVFDD